jgi:hypothetical protein
MVLRGVWHFGGSTLFNNVVFYDNICISYRNHESHVRSEWNGTKNRRTFVSHFPALRITSALVLLAFNTETMSQIRLSCHVWVCSASCYSEPNDPAQPLHHHESQQQCLCLLRRRQEQ